ncbi:FAD-linked sulfhydryl oxidase [Novymonas esmeraldas]|uniref:Sulfhydryl oxidase n=1 Tax=Novymonas esmeraldas TaxID=1808958 RepID=A0AAW0EPH9_9TRYP
MSTDSESQERLTTIPGECPTPMELGASGWNILHSSAAVYPYKPSATQQTAMTNFIEAWAHVYACSWCAYHMRTYVRDHPPDVRDKLTISRYVCEMHNEVSARLGNDVFDCSPDVVLRRWHPGYPNTMDDTPTVEEQLAAAARETAAAAAAKRRQQAEEERRFSDFGLNTRRAAAPPEAAAWRDGAAAAAPAKAAGSGGGGGVWKWWFFGKPAFSATPDASATADAATTAPPPQQQQQQSHPTSGAAAAAALRPSGNGGVGAVRHGWNTTTTTTVTVPETVVMPTPSHGKAADDETDVEAVLARLKRCQVYCPENDSHKR